MSPMRVAQAVAATVLLVLSAGCGPDTASSQEPDRKASPVPLFAPSHQHAGILGTVDNYNDSKGFGFILPDDGGKLIFVSASQIIGDGFRSLEAGQRVWFDIDMTPKAPIAINVSLVEEPG